VRRVPTGGTAGWLNRWASPANRRQSTPKRSAVRRNSRSTSWQKPAPERLPPRFRPRSGYLEAALYLGLYTIQAGIYVG
jgi:hypothetical protein